MGGVLKEDDDDEIGGNEEVVIVESEAGDDDDGGDDRVVATSGDGNDDERESIRERRRQEKLDRKERREKAISRDKLELDFLRKRNDDLERRVSVQEQRAYQSDLNGLDAHINKAVNDAQLAERVIAKAVESGNGNDVTQAMRYRDQALAKLNQLNLAKQQAERRPVQVPQLDDMAMHHAKEFLKDNPWYDAQGRDEESAIVLAIDNALSKDGYDPKSEDYWDELRHRASRRLPERFGKAPAPRSERTPRGGPAVGSGREHAPASTRKEIHISPERKAALMEAGVWDDPVLRMKYAKRYADYDRNNR
jgi:hypothetical protein